MNTNHQKAWKLALILAVSALLSSVEAQIVLHDNDSTALIDPTTQAGMFHWDINGQNQLQQQWFWYGIGAGPVASIDTISPPNPLLIGPNEARITYGNQNFVISIDYLLSGGSPLSANADIGESITIFNSSAAALPFHFYQYSHFTLSPGGDTVQLGTNPRGKFNDAYQFSGPVALTETVVTPGADHGEVAPLGGTLAKLNGGGPVTLGPPFFAGPLGPGDVTWALEWDFNLDPGATMLISKDKFLQITPIPEPSGLALIGLGLIGLLAVNRRSR